jgi:hypothetical protein
MFASSRFVLGWKKLGLETSLGTRLVIYADDLVILCRRGNAEAAEGELRGDRRGSQKFLAGYRWFESISLQRRVCELSVPLLSRPEGDVRGIGFQTVRTYIAIGNSEARGAMLARTIFGVAENSQAYRGPRARHPPRIEAF